MKSKFIIKEIIYCAIAIVVVLSILVSIVLVHNWISEKRYFERNENSLKIFSVVYELKIYVPQKNEEFVEYYTADQLFWPENNLFNRDFHDIECDFHLLKHVHGKHIINNLISYTILNYGDDSDLNWIFHESPNNLMFSFKRYRNSL